MKKQHYLCIAFLAILPLLLIFISMPEKTLFASQIDYLPQHITIPDYLRTLFYENGTLFADYAPHLQGGTNLYAFSYYGLFRPDVLLSFLFPMVSMKTIIITYSIFLMMLGNVVLFIWLSRKGFSWKISLFAAFLYACSSVFFHSHRQIMFVNYMPFLIMALMSIDTYFKTKRITTLTLSIIFIILHSYFFAIAAIVICLVYFYLEAKKYPSFQMMYVRVWISIAFAIMACAILLLPTAQVIVANKKSVAPMDYSILATMNPQLNGLLYDPYGCGLSIVCWASLVVSISNRKSRILGWILIACFSLPIISFLLNGTLYVRYKILLVCLPLMLYQLSYTLSLILKKELRLQLIHIPFIFIPLFFLPNKTLVFIDIIFALILLYFLRTSQPTALFILYSCLVLVLFHFVNEPSTYLDTKKYEQVYTKDKAQLLKRHTPTKRIADFSDNFYSANYIQNANLYKLSSYTSTNNTLFNEYLYDVMNAPISIANRTANLDNSQIFMQSMLGVENIITKTKVPVGYTCKDTQGEYQYCENKKVLPLAYATSQTMSENTFDQIPFPYTLDTIHNNAIVDSGKSNYKSQIEKVAFNLHLRSQNTNANITKTYDSYRVQANKTSKLKVDLQLAHPKQILIITFDVETISHKKKAETIITINQITNKLSKQSAPYPNGNSQFVYVISSDEAIDTLDITLHKGTYEIRNINMYTMDYQAIQTRVDQLQSLQNEKTTGNEVLKGKVSVKEDGYFITSLPYEKGYQAYVDGQAVNIEKVNKAFVGFPITKGKHDIQIDFYAPYKKIAGVLSILAWIMIGIQFLYERRKHHA